MATFFKNGDPGCDSTNWDPVTGPKSSDPASFAPTALNVTQWIESMKALGVKEAVLTAKHGCGFLLWDTDTKLPDGSPYAYHVPKQLNVLQQFSTAMESAGLGHGFYYSLTNNFYLNVQGHYVQHKRPLLPKQQNVSQAEFEAIALAQLTELWTSFGTLSEIWFDGGYTTDMKAQLTTLLQRRQAGAIGYNGGGISANPARWSKTEGDVPPGGPDVWSTACGDVDWGAGAPPEACPPGGQPLYYPSGTDYTLQTGDVWFWEPSRADGGSQTLRSLDELIYAYHQTVGHNTVLELDFAINRHGQLDAAHADLYARLGEWIRQCYSSPLGRASSSSWFADADGAEADAEAETGPLSSSPASRSRASNVTVVVNLGAAGQTFDRAVLQEDQRKGQRVRAWTVEWLQASSSGSGGGGGGGGGWTLFGSGKSIGNKRILIAPGAQSHNASAVRLTISSWVTDPSARWQDAAAQLNVTVAVFAPCSTGTPSRIRKLGTEDIGMTETTPIVFGGELYRFESVRAGNWNNTRRDHAAYLRIRRQSGPPSWLTGEIVTADDFGVGWILASAFVEKTTTAVAAVTAASTDRRANIDGTSGEVVHCFASQEKQEVAVFTSSELSPTAKWEQRIAITLPTTYTVFNTAVAKGKLGVARAGAMASASANASAGAGAGADDVYAMAIEVRAPLGGGFYLVFATATAAIGPYTLQHDPAHKQPDGLMFGPGSCPALRFDAATGYWHMLYTPNPTVAGGDYRTWQVYAARSKTLRYGDWELSPQNPVLEADAFDRQIHNTQIPKAQQGWAANTTNLNDSDPDLVEFEGQVLLVLNWGDQRTTPTNSLGQAVFDGSLEEFWASLYPG
eukprot:g852.t1